MSNDAKADHALALIAALQTILDKLPEHSELDDETADHPHTTNNPTHELFVGALDQSSLAGLFTSIRIIHNIHNPNK